MQDALFDAHHSLEERHWWFRARRRAIRELGEAVMPPGGVVVDIGCGTGADVASFPASYQRYGIDQSARAIDFARERHHDIAFEVGALPGAGAAVIGRADLLLLCDVLEHVEDAAALLEFLVTTMKPGAHLLLTVPADPRLWSPHDVVYGHYRRYTPDSLAALLAKVPARTRLFSPFNRILYPAARVARAVASRRGRSWGSERGDLALPWRPVNWLLEHVFALELPALRAALADGDRKISGNGVSLLAVLQKHAPA